MKSWIKSHIKHILACILCVAVVVAGFQIYSWYRQPDVCALCGSGNRDRYHAPVILNLSTGWSNEMKVYDPGLPGPVYEISSIQTTGTFSFASCAGLTGRRDTCSHTCSVDIPMKTDRMVPAFFCSQCRALLKGYEKQGYVLVDVYAEDEISIYPIEVDADYLIRDYRITVTEDAEWERMQLVVHGQVEGLTFID